MNLIRKNLMSIKGYSPYCGNNDCKTVPRTEFNGEQFVCPHCGWVSAFNETFIFKYKKRWNMQDDKDMIFSTPTSEDNAFEKQFLEGGKIEKPYFEIKEAGFGSVWKTSHSTISGRYSSTFPNIQLIAKDHPKLTFLSVIDDQEKRLEIWKEDYNAAAHSAIYKILVKNWKIENSGNTIISYQHLRNRGNVR